MRALDVERLNQMRDWLDRFQATKGAKDYDSAWLDQNSLAFVIADSIAPDLFDEVMRLRALAMSLIQEREGD